ncbi:MAG: M23 family metallopeptidase [Candidatus Aegiribacteria sp.]|nr:M23 family metallopeptidase [Candidatus Aegiribacteria sp.]
MRSRIILISIFFLAMGATFLFRKPHSPETGGVWSLTDHLSKLEYLTDSLNSILADTIEVRTAFVEEGGTLGALLYSTGIEGNRYLNCCDILIDSLGWSSVHVGDTLDAFYARDTLTEVRARPRNGRGYYCIEFDGTADPVDWYWVPEEQFRRLRAVTLVVSSSVWESIASGGVPPDLSPSGHIVTARDSIREVAYIKGFENELANRLFVYDIDFYYDVQPGDSVWVLLEETRYPGSSETTFRRIVAAKYDFTLGGMTEAIPFFHQPDSLAPDGSAIILDHYHRDGASLRTMFLKMPVPFGRISSPYSDSRMHPVLGYTRVHRGIDYAAPMGTEIYAVGDGVITVRGFTGGYGNMVRLRHANAYETGYGHMNSYARHQEIGSYVRQGDVIGYVGSTGLSTGPHVHFEMKRNGSYVNPASEILPPANPLLANDLDFFMLQLPVLESTWSIMAGMDIPVSQPQGTESSNTPTE